MKKIAQKNLSVLGILIGSAIWGVLWYPYRLLANSGITGISSSFYTYCIIAIIAGVIFAKHWRGLFNLPISILWLGIFAGWTNLSYVLAMVSGEVMRVMLLIYLSPLWTLLLARYWLKEPITRVGLASILLALLGAFVMLWQPNAWPVPTNTAEWLALSTSVSFALNNVITRKSTHLSLRAKSFAMWLGVILMCMVALPFLGEHLASPASFSWWSIGLMVLISCLLIVATLFIQNGVSHIAASRTSVLLLFELVVAAIASYFLANEAMTINELLGGFLIVLAAIIAGNAED